MMNQEQIISKIVKNQPFSNLLKIKEIKSLAGPGVQSGESFMITDKHNKKYKFRFCSTIKEAKIIEKNVKLLPNAFPKFYGRDKNQVLFEWINGTLFYDMLSKPIPKEVYYQIGKLVGEAHELNDIDNSKSADAFFDSMIKTIKDSKKLEKSLINKLIQTHNKLKRKLKIDIVLEINDIHPRNFVIKNESNLNKIKVYFIDEGGFGHKIKGLGIAKPFFTEGIIKSKIQRNAFWKGYTEHHSNDYFDKDYQKFVTFIQIIRSIATKLRNNLDFKPLLKQLDKLI